jgi:integrase
MSDIKNPGGETGLIHSRTIALNLNDYLLNLSDKYAGDRRKMVNDLLTRNDILLPHLIYEYMIDQKQMCNAGVRKISHMTFNTRVSMAVKTLKEMRAFYRRCILNGAYVPENDSEWDYIALIFDRIYEKLIGLRYKQSRSTTTKDSSFRRILTEDDVSRIAASADPWTAIIIKLLFSTGIKVSELLYMRWEDISSVDGDYQLTVVSGKQRKVWIAKEYFFELERLFGAFERKGFVFIDIKTGQQISRPTLNSRIKKAARSTSQEFDFVSPSNF